jgi:hypothetical protein
MYLAGLQKQRAERRAQRESVECGEDDRDGDGDGKLLVQLARNAGNKSRGNEDRGENQGNGNDRAGDLLHGFDGGLARWQTFFDVMLHGFDDDDGVIDHQADGQHQSEEGKRVDGEAQHGEDNEGAYQRNRHRGQRNQRGTPALQEDLDH